jgi:nitroreductase
VVFYNQFRRKLMDPYQTILSLRAVRHFNDQSIPDEMMERILQAARWTGSARNTQPWEFVVVRDRQMLKALSICGPYASHLGEAALGVVLAIPPKFALFDAGRVTQNMMLAAWTNGVGSCIASFHDEDKVRALLEIPATFQANIAISFGYPAPDAPFSRGSKSIDVVLASVGRRPLSELVHWDHW